MRGCSCRGTAGFAHVSCLVEQAKILMDEAEYNNLGPKAFNERWERWDTCSLCKQDYHGVVKCALGWGCWKTYLGRPETDQVRGFAMGQLGNGLHDTKQHAVALPVREAELAVLRRIGTREGNVLAVQSNLAMTYQALGRFQESLHLRRDIYSGNLRLFGEEHAESLTAANNYASTLLALRRFEEAKSLFCKIIPVARRVLGENHDLTLKMRANYAEALYQDPVATLDDFREAVTTLEDAERTARRVFGGAHPLVGNIELTLRVSRAALSARETGDMSSLREAMAAMPPRRSA